MSDTAKLLEEVKQTIRSLLLSTQTCITVGKLFKDYREFAGHDLPYRRLNYSSPDELLRAFPDVVCIRYYNGEKLLAAVADENTQHIQKLVAKQRKQSSSSRGRSSIRRMPKPVQLPADRCSRAAPRPAPLQPATSYSRPTVDIPRLRRTINVKELKPVVPAAVQNNIRDLLLESYPQGCLLNNFNSAFLRRYMHFIAPGKYGFRDIEELLLSIPDVVTIQNTGNNPRVVAKKTDSGSTSSLSPPISRGNASHFPFDGRENTDRSLLEEDTNPSSHAGSSTLTPTSEQYVDEKPDQTPSFTVGLSISGATSGSLCQPLLSTIGKESELPSALCDKPDVSSAFSGTTRAVNGIPSQKYNYNDREDNHLESPVNNKLKEEIRKVLSLHPEGITSTLFPSKYKKATDKSLEVRDYGYHSIMELMNDIPDVVFSQRPKPQSAWILYDATKKKEILAKLNTEQPKLSSVKIEPPVIPNNFKKNLIRLLKEFSNGIKLTTISKAYKSMFQEDIDNFGYSSLELLFVHLVDDVVNLQYTDNEIRVFLLKDAQQKYLPALAFSATSAFVEKTVRKNVPPGFDTVCDAVLPGKTLPLQKLPKGSKLNSVFEVIVSQCNNPGQFWVQLANTTADLEDLMNDLETVYNSDPMDLEQYAIPHSYYVIGLLCAALYNTDWHRARIIGFKGQDEATVYYVDYGTQAVRKKSELRLLKQSLTELPAQALQAKLYNIEPTSADGKWTKAATARFFDLSTAPEKVAMLTGEKTDKMTQDPVLLLCLSEGDDWIGDILVAEGHAVFSQGRQEEEDKLVDRVEAPEQQKTSSSLPCPPASNPLPATAATLTSAEPALQNKPIDTPTTLTLNSEMSPAMMAYMNAAMLNNIATMSGAMGNTLMPNFGNANMYAMQYQLAMASMNQGLMGNLWGGLGMWPNPMSNLIENSMPNSTPDSTNFTSETPTKPNAKPLQRNVNTVTSTASTSETYNVDSKNFVEANTQSSSMPVMQDAYNPGTPALKRPIVFVEQPLNAHGEPHKTTSSVGNRITDKQPVALDHGHGDQITCPPPHQSVSKSNVSLQQSSTGADSDSACSEDEAMIEQLCRELDNLPTTKKRYVKLCELTADRHIHLILFNDELHMVGAEVSAFFWKKDLLRNMLRIHSMRVESQIVTEEGEPELFSELVHYSLCGEGLDGRACTATLYPLSSVLKVLDKFKPVADTIKDAIVSEMENFNPKDTYWGSYVTDSTTNFIGTPSLTSMDLPDLQEFTLQILINRRDEIHMQLMADKNNSLQEELTLLNNRISLLEDELNSR